MKTLQTTILAFILCCGDSFAQSNKLELASPPEVTAQLTKDLLSLVKVSGNRKHSDEQISQAVVKIVDEAIKPHPKSEERSR